MKRFQIPLPFLKSLLLLIFLNGIIKPLWIFGVDRQVQNITGYEVYGTYFAFMNLSLVLNFMLDMGITPYFNKTASGNLPLLNKLILQSFVIKWLLSACFALIIFFIAISTGVSTGYLFWLLVLFQILTSFLLWLRAILSATQQFSADAIVSAADKIFATIIAGIGFYFLGWKLNISIETFVLIQIAGLLIAILLCLYFLTKTQLNLKQFSGSVINFSLLKGSLPFALTYFFMSMHSRTDGFLLERLLPNGAYKAGIYASGYRLVDAINMGGFLISSFLLPYIANRWPDKNALAPLIRMCRHVLMLSSLCIAIVVAHWSDDVNNLLYNGRDTSAGNVIAVLLFTLPALGLVHIYGTLLTATGNIIRFMIISAFFALINITFNLIFIPQFGLSAAMWIAVITQTLYAIVVCFDAVKQTTIKFAFSDLLIYLAVAAALLLCLNHLF